MRPAPVLFFALAALGTVVPAMSASAGPLQVYGAWHCSNDACDWATPRTIAEFDAMNHWLIDRGDGRPSVNLVVLSFVHPLKLLNQTTDAATLNGVPRGMTPSIVNYFASRDIRVMLSIGGSNYADAWSQALAQDATMLGLRAAQLATQLGVGIEIDYEEDTHPDLAGLQEFITAYRSVIPYDATGRNKTARLTIDLAAGDQWLIDLGRKAATDWLRTNSPVLDYANAMVPDTQPSSANAIANWKEHVVGKPQYVPAYPPVAPAKLTAGLYLAGASRVRAECNRFSKSLQRSTGNFVQTVAPNGAGTTAGMLGYMFWAAERPSDGVTTQPPNSCERGVGVGAATYNIPIPMPTLRQR